MKVTFKELGFVKSCTVDLNKDLTILCGPNNSGKTYVACAVSGLLKLKQLYRSSGFEQVINEILNVGKVQVDLSNFMTNELTLKEIAAQYQSEISKVFAADPYP